MMANLMRASALFGVLTMASASAAYSAGPDAFTRPRVRVGTVHRVVDGDTVHIIPARGTEVLKVRMLSIDAPESHFPTEAGPVVGQPPFGGYATDALKRLIPPGTKIELHDFGLDKYFRTLGRVILHDTDINLKMVEVGMVVPYIRCEGEDCDRRFFERHSVEKYVKACDKAKKAGVGIFNPRNPLKELPYDFRHRLNDRPKTLYTGDFKTKQLYNPDAGDKVPPCRRIFFQTIEEARRVGYR